MNHTTAPAPAPAPSAPAVAPAPLPWDEVVATAQALGGGAFLASVQRDGRPHVAWVVPGFGDQRLWVATFASSQKAANLRHDPAVAIHWPERPDQLLFARGAARLVADRDESDRCWDDGVVPYDPAAFFGTKDNPDLLFVELTLTRVTMRSLFAPTDPPRVWTPTS